MKKIIKSIVTGLLSRKQYVALENFWMLKQWNKNNHTGPSPHCIKSKTIQEYKKKFNYNILIETGTYMGDMIEAQKKWFNKIYSIEISEKLYKKAQKRFKKYEYIRVLHGDSSLVLPFIIEKVNEPAIFWLDGHYSAGITERGAKDCPIFEEVDAIFNGKALPHVILIDDARCFIGEGDYPTIEELTTYIRNRNIKYKIEIKNDIIRFVI